MKSIYISFLCFLIVGFCYGQEYEVKRVDVFEDGRQLQFPSAGGLRAPQINVADINLDGVDDIILFDREGDVIIPLIGEGEGHVFDPAFRKIFPKLNNWMRLADYNGDGITDLFCAPVAIGIPGVEVYKGVITDGVLSFERLLFPDDSADILFYPIGSSRSQVYVSPADQPDIRDIDGDGDIDILSFEPSGGTVFFYENQTADRGLDPDEFDIILGDQCYGGFVESGFSQDVTLSTSAGDCANTNVTDDDMIISKTRHAGSTVTAIDITGDNLPELLLGDIAYDGIVKLENGGNENLAWMTSQEPRFPQASDEPIDFELFLSVYFKNVDDDDTEELVVTSNDRSGSQALNHIWMYDRVQTPGSRDQFLLRSKNYLVEDMIFTGEMSAPLFIDINSDGLEDLLIGTSGKTPDGISIDPRVILYQNTGTSNEPQYTLQNDNFLGMAEFSTTSRHFAPALGDIDGDGDGDLVFGDNNGLLYYAENRAQTAGSYLFSTVEYNPWDIRVSAWAKPAIYDANKDGLGDLVIGEQNFNSSDGDRGSLNLFLNIGQVGDPSFNADEFADENDPIWGGVFQKEAGFINNFSAPFIIDLKDRHVLVSGTERGVFYLYDSLAAQDEFALVTSNLGMIREGNVGTVAFADIDNDDLMEMAVGSRRGGISFYETDLMIDIESSTSIPLVDGAFEVIPSLTALQTTVTLSDIDCTSCQLRMTDMSGRLWLVEESPTFPYAIDVSGIPDGTFVIELGNSTFRATQKLVKIKN